MNRNGNQYGPNTIADSARAILGNVGNITHNYYYGPNEARTEEDWKLLLTSFCYESMNDRKHQVYAASGKTCEWIWNTAFARWLRVKPAKIFWISGKPGSGKSTLMKYLSRLETTEQNLPAHFGSWVVIDFFFDYRLADKTGNTIEGLLRSLLAQIITKFPDVGKELSKGSPINSHNSLECLESDLQLAISMVHRCFLVLIDGLDEFSAGNLTYLAEFLLRLKGLQRVKVCLASRPEAEIQSVFEGIPKLAMSEHNLAGIEQYMNIKFDKFPSLSLLSSTEIRNLILRQSDGVFLWVHLVLDEIVEECAKGATLEDLKETISVLPTKLEPLYDRILERIPTSRQTEAATIFALVDTSDTYVTLSLLRHTMYFLAHETSISSLPSNLTEAEHFKRRLHGTMRGLVDLVKGTDERYPGVEQKYPTLRLIHRTLHSYAEKRPWFHQHLPGPLQQVSQIWTYISSKAIVEAGRHISDRTQFELLYPNEIIKDYSSFAKHMVRLSSHEDIVHWLALLFHSIIHIPTYAETSIQNGSRALQAISGTALRSPVNYIHYALYARHSVSSIHPVAKSLTDDISDLVLAAAHNAVQYLKHKRDRIKDLSDDQRRELVAVVIFTSIRRQQCPGQCPYVSSQAMRDVVDYILCFDRKLSSFHLGVYLFLGYIEKPEFLSRFLHRQNEYRHTETPVIPSWFTAEALFAAESPLFIWACEYQTPPGLTWKAQLDVLSSFDFDINCRSSAGYNIVHYLITRHIIGHHFLEQKNDCLCCPSDGDDIADAVVKLYVLEEAGADFTMQYEHRTPLQAFRHGVDLIRQATATELAQDIPEARFQHFDFTLQHKEQTGHLPQPMVGESCWQPHRISLLQERKCDVCSAGHVEIGKQDNQVIQVTPSRPQGIPVQLRTTPSPSRIPRPKRSDRHSQLTGNSGNTYSGRLSQTTASSSLGSHRN